MSTKKAKYSWLQGAQTVVSKRKKSHDSRGLNSKHTYSSFWMDQDDDDRFGSRFADAGKASTDTVKLVKLLAYRKAVTNFVKIVTKQEIPVMWYGDGSFTNGKAITLSTGIKDSNFDVTVGLALHEASHVVLTDFDLLRGVYASYVAANDDALSKYLGLRKILEATGTRAGSKGITNYVSHFKDLHNWIEDRRIDHYVFSTSPGYRAYYHKLYDEYWNSKDIAVGIISSKYADPTKFDSYEFHIYNMINPLFNAKVMPGLDQIVKLIGLGNIERLQSTEDTFLLTNAVFNVILDQMEDAQNGSSSSSSSQQQNDSAASKSEQQSSGMGSGSERQEDKGDQGDQQQPDGETIDSTDGDHNEDGSEEGAVQLDSSATAEAAAAKVLRDQRSFLNDYLGKKRATNKLQKQLERVAAQDVQIETSSFLGKTRPVLNLYYTNEHKMGRLFDMYQERISAGSRSDSRRMKEIDTEMMVNHYFGADNDDFVSHRTAEYVDCVKAGLDLGGLLGRKLQVHNDARVTVTNRLRSGKIDSRRLAHAGYGIESVFNQITVDKCKPAHMHISIDGSGSMLGTKWRNTIKTVVAIAKAVNYVQNIDLQVSVRSTRGGEGTPCNIMIYNSKINSLNHICRLLNYFSPNSATPEGLCYEGMLKAGLFKPSDSSVDSYLINISDGMPQGCSNYYGAPAYRHTRSMVQKMTAELNMQVLSYYVEDNYSGVPKLNLKPSYEFVQMYGKSAEAIDATSVIQIARTMNKMFLSSRA